MRSGASRDAFPSGERVKESPNIPLTPSPAPPQGGVPSSPEGVKESPSDTGATSKKKQKPTPRAIHSVVARRRMTTPVVNTPSDTGATSKKKNHRHSGIFRVADLGPGTMPRGKYPESPARAGSHALISRTPTPGGMLHANLGLPRPPPRAFQAPMTSWATSMNIAASSPIPMRFMNFISWRSSVRSWAISARSSAMSPRVATCLSNS